MPDYNNKAKPNFNSYKHFENTHTEFAKEMGATSNHSDKKAKQKSGRKMASIKGGK